MTNVQPARHGPGTYLGVSEEGRRAGRVLEQGRRGGPLALPPVRGGRLPPPSPLRIGVRLGGGGTTTAFDVVAGGALLARAGGGVGDHGQVVLLRIVAVVRLPRLAVEPRAATGVGGGVVVEVRGPAGLAAAAALGARRRRHRHRQLLVHFPHPHSCPPSNNATACVPVCLRLSSHPSTANESPHERAQLQWSSRLIRVAGQYTGAWLCLARRYC
jgi:hypothetical protein